MLCALVGGLVLLAGLHEAPAHAQVTQNVLTDPSNVAGAQTARPADVDADGTRDVIVASSGNERVSWFPGEGGGSYGPQQIINDAAGEAVQAVPANVDGGAPDVIVHATGPTRIYWHPGESGGFASTAQTIYHGSADARDVAIADLDQDGDDDVLVAFDGDVAWFRNDGSGGFTRVNLGLSDSDFSLLAVANLNPGQDGDLDLVTLSTGATNRLAVHDNDGSEAFASTTLTTNFEDPEALTTGDVTENGGPDVIFSVDDVDTGPQVAYIDNQGARTYASDRTLVDDSRGADQIRTVDADASGTTDLFTLFGDAAFFYPGDGSGVGTPVERLTDVRMGSGDVFFADETGDAAPDLFVTALIEDRVAYRENDGTGASSTVDRLGTASNLNYPSGLATMDVDGDGAEDVLATGINDRKVVWFEQDATGALSFTGPKTIATLPQGVIDVAVADFDGQNGADIAVAARPFITDAEGALYLFRNDGAGGFTRSTLDGDLAGGEDVEAADLDGDGDVDLAVSALGGTTVRVYDNTGGGAFSAGTTISPDPPFTPFSFAFIASDLVAADLTGDQRPELVALRAGFEDDVVYYPNQSGTSISFGQQETVINPDNDPYSRPVAVAPYNLDQTGETDLVISFNGTQTISGLENQGGTPLTFGTPRDLATGITTAGSDRLQVTDLDGANRAELLVGTFEEVAFFRNEGGATFAPKQVVTSKVSGVRGVAVFDFNQDGFPELLSASRDDDKVAWYNNQDGALPVELAAFTARRVDGDDPRVQLTWRTASESGNAGFRVERQTDAASGAGWQRVGYVASKAAGGTSSEALSYRYRDAGVPFAADTARYRLTQVDTDGGTSRSEVIDVALGGVDQLQLQAPYPNPAQEAVTVPLAVPKAAQGDATLRLYNALGRRVRTVSVGIGRQQVQVATDGLASGVYFLRLSGGPATKTRRLTIVR